MFSENTLIQLINRNQFVLLIETIKNVDLIRKTNFSRDWIELCIIEN